MAGLWNVAEHWVTYPMSYRLPLLPTSIHSVPNYEFSCWEPASTYNIPPPLRRGGGGKKVRWVSI